MSMLLIAGQRVPVASYLEEPASLAGLLASARDVHGSVLCECTNPARRMVVREYSNALGIAVWPHDGHLHDKNCPFWRAPTEDRAIQSARFAPAPGSGETATNPGMRSAFAMSRSKAPAKKVKPDAADRDSAPRQEDSLGHRTGLAGLLEALWKEARLSVADPRWRLNWWWLHRRISDAAEGMRLNDKPLLNFLHVVEPFLPERRDEIEARFHHWVDCLMQSGDGRIHRGLVMAEVAALERSQFGYAVKLKQTNKPLYCTPQQVETFVESFPKAVRLVGVGGEDAATRSVALFLVEPSQSGHLKVVDAAWMLTSRAYLPVASLPEAQWVNDLIARGARVETTPLSGRGLAADLVLEIDGRSTAAVVFSMAEASDLDRQAERLTSLRRSGLDVVAWDAYAGASPPM